MKLGIIVRSDNTGLANQTLAITKMLNPSKVILINSTPFNGNIQHPDKYKGYGGLIVDGFIRRSHIRKVLAGITHLITCEIPYNYQVFSYAKAIGVKTVLQPNFEFLDYLIDETLPYPDAFFLPSNWRVDEINSKFSNKTKIEYLPPPTFEADYEKAKNINMSRSGKIRILHVRGREAVYDRNGTESILMSLKHSKADYELVIRSQSAFNSPLLNDPRVKLDIRDLSTPQELYEDFDFMVYPRRYGGQAMPCNEALISGLPVIMNDIDPNNRILPKKWLVKATKESSFRARTDIDVYTSNYKELGAKIDELVSLGRKELDKHKQEAYNLGIQNFSPSVLKNKWLEALEKL